MGNMTFFGQRNNHGLKYVGLAAFMVLLWFTYRLQLHKHGRALLEQTLPQLSGSSYPSGSASHAWDGAHTWESHSYPNVHPDVLSEDAAYHFCTNYRLEPLPRKVAAKRKIYDLLIVNTELDMLELRLGQMSPGVDYFSIIESDITFTDKPKPLYVKENYARFAPYHKQMMLRTMDLTKEALESTWSREAASRNAMFTQVIPFLEGEQAANEDDVLLVSDVDEFIKPEPLKAMRNCAIPLHTTIRSRFFYYSYQWLTQQNWEHPQATLYKGAEGTVTPQDLRFHAADYAFLEGGWHCSYCFPTVHELIKKITSFSHSELDLPENKDPATIVKKVRYGMSVFSSDNLTRIERNYDIPDFIKSNPVKYKYLVDRDAPNANFVDWDADTQSFTEIPE